MFIMNVGVSRYKGEGLAVCYIKMITFRSFRKYGLTKGTKPC